MAADSTTIDTSEFFKRVPNENTARIILEGQRWRGMPRCPTCGCINHIQDVMPYGQYRCLPCKMEFNVRTGSHMHDVSIPLQKWLFGMFALSKTSFAMSERWLAETINVSLKDAGTIYRTLRNSATGQIDPVLLPIKTAQQDQPSYSMNR